MNAAIGLMDGLGLDGDRCIRVIPRHNAKIPTLATLCISGTKHVSMFRRLVYVVKLFLRYPASSCKVRFLVRRLANLRI